MSDFGEDLASRRDLVHRFALRLTQNQTAADDLCSEVMLKAWVNREKFITGTNLTAWLTTITRNIFLTGMRRAKWDGGSTDDMLESALPSRPAPQGAAIDLADAVKALDLLPRDQREALLLVGAGASYEEAAEELCCSVGTIKSRVARGRDALAEALA